MPDGRWRDSAVQQFVMQVAQTQAVVAVDWAQSIGEDSTRNWAVGFALRQWARQDPAAASEWLQNMPDGRGRDMAVQEFALQLASTQPAIAAEWGASIDDESLRANALTAIGSMWLQKDRQAATQWLRSSPLSESTRQSLLNSAGGNASVQWSGGGGVRFLGTGGR